MRVVRELTRWNVVQLVVVCMEVVLVLLNGVSRWLPKTG
jgi:hypothetical protein